jgi:hypothetical protein
MKKEDSINVLFEKLKRTLCPKDRNDQHKSSENKDEQRDSMTLGRIKHKGYFKKGQSGNPSGRPVGASGSDITKVLMAYKTRRNDFTLALFQRIESIGDSLVTKAVDLAMAGNEKMLAFLLDKGINPNLINKLEKPIVSKTVEDIDNSQQMVISNMGSGNIDMQHGLNLVKALALKRDSINVRQLEDQVREIVNVNK